MSLHLKFSSNSDLAVFVDYSGLILLFALF
jgi:hypothetical protein